MKALILAAGLGSRLKQKTADRPKAMTVVAGKTILDYQLEALRENGVAAVGVVLGHAGDRLIRFIRENHPGLDATFLWNREFAESNSSWSFWQAKDWIGTDAYLHLNCDIIFSAGLLRRLLDSPFPNVITVRKDVPLGDKMENVVLEGDRIVDMSLVNTPEASAKAFGLSKLGPESTRFIVGRLADHLALGDRNQNYYGMIREAVRHVDYRALEPRTAEGELLLEVNTLKDLETAESVLQGRFGKAST